MYKFRLVAIFPMVLLAIATSASPFYGSDSSNTTYVITQHGVGTDSSKLSTAAIQQVIDKAEANGGGTIVVPKGVFLTGALFFKPNTKLQLQEGAQLKGSDDISHYPLLPSRMEGRPQHLLLCGFNQCLSRRRF